MEQSKAKILKSIIESIVFIALLASFLVFYFINETKEFMKGSTTFATRTEEVTKYSMPVLVLCFEKYKPSIFGNQSADLTYNLEEEQFIFNEDEVMTDFLKSASYKLNQDVQIELEVYFSEENYKTYQLHEGQNGSDDFRMKVYQIITLIDGPCYVLDSTENLDISVSFQVTVRDTTSKSADHLANLSLYLASHETWYGIIAKNWPYFELKKRILNFSPSYSKYWLDFFLTRITYRNGQSNVKECIENVLKSVDVCKKCIPFFFSFLSNQPSCKTLDENKCWYDGIINNITGNYLKYKKCMKPTEMTLYKTKPLHFQRPRLQSNSVIMIFTFGSNEITIKEETLMIGSSSYIGSIGGSLGLFLGFSFFTFLSSCADKVFGFFSCRQ